MGNTDLTDSQGLSFGNVKIPTKNSSEKKLSERTTDDRASTNYTSSDNDQDKKETVVKDLYAYIEADDGKVTTWQLLELLEDFGFTRSDHRLATLRKRLKSINGIRKDIVMDYDTFHSMVKGSTVFLMKALKGQL